MFKTRQIWGCFTALAGATLLAGSVAAADLAPVEPAPATPDVPFDLAFGVKGTTNYIFRGISQSNNKPVIQGYAEAQFLNNWLYAGFFYSKVDLVTRPSCECDFSAGVRPKFGPLAFDFGYILYGYPNERRLLSPDYTTYTNYLTGQSFDAPIYLTPKNTDFGEVHGAVTYNAHDTYIVGAGVYYAWNWLGTGAPGTYVNATAKYNVPEGFLGFMPSGFSVSGELGYYDLGYVNSRLAVTSYGTPLKLKSYTTWNVGAAYTYKNLSLDLRYYDTNLNKGDCFLNTSDPQGYASGSGQSKWCGAAFVATLSADFTLSGLKDLLPK